MVSGTVETEFILKGDRAIPESFSGALQALFTDDGGIITIPTAELNKASQPRPFIVVIPSEDMEELRRQAQHGRLKFVPQFSVVESLTYALEAQDKYTAGHSHRVAELAYAIGKMMGLKEEFLEQLKCAAVLHDIGKIAVDKAVQNKPGRLTAEEYHHIMSHVHIGQEIVKPIFNEEISDMVRYHHHHYDGHGYENHLSGEAIPLGARIIGVADAFDAMTSDRPYRPRMSTEQAIQELEKGAGTQFDPAIVSIFVAQKRVDSSCGRRPPESNQLPDSRQTA